jgi:hypothetical protein
MLFDLKRQSASDLIWIIGAILATIALAVILYGARLFDRNVDLHFHDTYFVVPRWLISLALFLLVLFIAFFYKSSRKELRTSMSFLIVLGSGVVIILLLTILIAFSSFFLSGGWTIYPPLSALGKDEFIQTNPDFPFSVFASLIAIFQLPIALMALRSAMQFGQYRAARSSQKS